MKQLKELTFRCSNSKCMVPSQKDEKKLDYFTFKTRDWMVQTGYNDEDGTYIYIEEKCPKCGLYCKKYYSVSDLLMMIMTEEV